MQNLLEALRQINQYMGLGVAASVSAAALELGYERRQGEDVSLHPVPVPMPRWAAQLVLLGVAFVAGLMGSSAVESAQRIANTLGDSPLRAAACTYPSVATAPPGLSLMAVALVTLCVAPIFLRRWRRLHEGGILGLYGFFAIPYVVMAFELTQLHCPAR